MEGIKNYWSEYPNLFIQLYDYFVKEVSPNGGGLIRKNIFGFIDYYNKQPDKKDPPPQPQQLAYILDKLCDIGAFVCLDRGGMMNLDNAYFHTENTSLEHYTVFKDSNIPQYECYVYGLQYVYEKYKKIVVPILHINTRGDQGLGTGFFYNGGIVTAKHCIEGASSIAIKGIDEMDLKDADIIISKNLNIDVAFISFKSEKITKNILLSDDSAGVMDSVITMGFPTVAGFHNFTTAEEATISAISNNRFTASRGTIIAQAEEIFMRENLFLITAKIRGGNSGGPVLNRFGKLVGVVSEIPLAQGDYDDLGYGVAIPSKIINEIILNKDTEKLNTSKISFNKFD